MRKRSRLQFDEAGFDDLFHKESDYVELPTSNTAFFVVIFAAVLIVGTALGKTGILFLQDEWYVQRARANVTQEMRVPTHRALILDRFGTPLAENKSSFSVFLNLEVLSHELEDRASIVNTLSEHLGLDVSEFEELIGKANPEHNNWIVVARDIDQSQAIVIRGMEEGAVRVVDDYERIYSKGATFAHILGYTGLGEVNEVVGKAGIEYTYDEVIRGTEGAYAFYEDARGSEIGGKLIHEPEASSPLTLTIDAELQEYFYNRLQSGLWALGRISGIGIALDPRNGEVLSLVSLPSFDNNMFVDGARSEERGALLESSSKPLFNRAVSGNYNPGSTIKPLVALAALREGVMDDSTQVYSDGTLEIPNVYNPDLPSIFLDWKAHGWVDVKEALARSSNIYFYLAGGGLPQTVPLPSVSQGFGGVGVGIDTLRGYWEELGFGKEVGIDLPFEASGFLPSPEEKEKRTGEIWRLGDSYNISIGQGDLSVTPLQLISFIASIGNDGEMYTPFLNAAKEPTVAFDYSSWRKELMVVKEGLRDAVEMSYGTAYSLSDLPFSVSGKTGSAQTNNNTRINALFMGYAPSDNPEIAILVLVENAREGSSNTLPIAKDVLGWYYENRLTSSEVE